jgi:hypothetical protein
VDKSERLFRNAIIELSVLTLMIIVMVAAIMMLRRRARAVGGR